MLIRKIIVLIIISLFRASLIISCSCERLYFCEYLKNDDKKVVFRATVVNYKEYSSYNTAVYLQITEIYRDDVGVTNVIKLYGSTESAGCQVDFRSRFTKGADLFIALGIEYNGNNVGFDYVNPDDIFEDFWEFAPHLCTTVVLSNDENRINGSIAPSISEYPIEQFLLRLDNCDYSLAELNNYRCLDADFLLYPNPTADGTIKIINGFKYSAVQTIRVISIDGRILFSDDFNNDPFQKTEISFKNSGLFIMEIRCNENIEYRKFIVE